jgi:hypothetical protein
LARRQLRFQRRKAIDESAKLGFGNHGTKMAALLCRLKGRGSCCSAAGLDLGRALLA